VEAVQREAKVLESLPESVGAPKLLELVEFENGCVGLLMERCRGQPLREVQTEKELEWFVIGAAKGLQALHTAGWVHGDVKESNFCVDQKRREVRLIDFEFAGQIGMMPEGYTDGYRAPETMREDEPVYSPKSDMYSLGVAVEKMLSRSEIDSDVWKRVVEGLKRDNAEERWGAQDLVEFFWNSENVGR
jgi:serine/threonine protein kinase